MQDSEIIERIKYLCDARSWTVYRLAKESGITYSTLCTMLHKSNAPSIPTLQKICQGFGISPSQFFDCENDLAALTASQREHLRLWNALSESNQQAVDQYLRFLISQQESGKSNP